jgi:branched-chain amino acid aminotransferase
VAIQPTDYIWLDGRHVPWAQGNVHLMTHTLHYGLGVFEGIRCYACEDGRSAVFRLREHVDRLFRSARIMQIDIPFSRQAIEDAVVETLRINQLTEGYIRPLVFLGDGGMGLLPSDNPVRIAILVWEWGAYLGEEGIQRGIRAKVSSFTRQHPNASMTKAKTCGEYVNSILAKREVTKLGYQEAILLDAQGMVAEASGENVFMVRDGAIKTPPLGSILEGITRDTIIALARDKGISIAEVAISRDELYGADEMFMTGTAAEVTPVREVDDRKIGEGTRGPITRTLQETFFDVVHGREPKHEAWLTFL